MNIPDFSDPAIWLSLLTLTFLEIVLGVDNIIFISIISDRLDPSQQKKARNIGLLLAMVMRIILLLTITWILRLQTPLFTLPYITAEGQPVSISWKDLIMMAGGLFLVVKSTLEIHHKLEKPSTETEKKTVYTAFSSVVLQIVMVDAVFSFDSILTAIGMVDEVFVMIVAVIISIAIMMLFAGPISRFINKNPTLQMLALSFLIAIGIMLVAEGFHQKISKSYIYTMIAFSLLVELLNMRLRKRNESIELPKGKKV
ncbi:TerC family protein [Terrimonas sp. NA20]|uniref:TerC family protein n=1 Tax=Terrimonas ginsenosidimutans TaxID=2908004 RepID=A0ABS9KYB4_9BACT|nr:TerC family protein [Terrimonas ginsenosidimutans]MCG2617331.1 TerC family protein [Terrimonas ginsenosidimutans]